MSNQSKLREYLLTEYVENNEFLIDNTKIKDTLKLLLENNYASKISGTADIYSAFIGLDFKYICKKMCDYNKELENFKEKNISETPFMKAAYIPKEYLNLTSYVLEPGIYYAEYKKGKNPVFLVLEITADEKDDFYKFYNLYFVGKKCNKLRNKFFSKMEKFEEKLPPDNQDFIRYIDGRGVSPCIFKSFDQMIFTNKKKIVEYIDNWKRNIPEYNKYGMIPKLSILLYGDPGTGKSSFCRALAKHLGISEIVPVPSSYFDTNSERKTTIRGYDRNETIYTIDDIDCIGNSREEDKSIDNSQIISSLLEFLDNPPTFYFKIDDNYYLVSIVCATTNYYDRLDPAVKRYGRFDLKIEMKKFNKDQAQEMCDLYDLKLEDIYPGKIEKDTEFSPAYVQSLCTENIDNKFKKKD